MVQTRPEGTVSDRLAAAETAALVGRVEERARLGAMLSSQGLAAVFVHGPGGIGKTVLVGETLAALPLKSVTLDGRRMEPTVPGALLAIGAALGGSAPPSATEPPSSLPRPALTAWCSTVSNGSICSTVGSATT